MIKLAYFGDGKDIDIEDQTIGQLTHINWSFLTLQDKVGTLGHGFKNINKLEKIKELYPHIKVSLAIGGWGANHFSEAVENEENRNNFCNTAAEFLVEFDADGIDLDWEYPCTSGGNITMHPNDKENFVLLMKQLRKKLNEVSLNTGKQYILTSAVGASVGSQIGIDFKQLTPIVDFYNVMTYDMGGTFGTSGHHTSVYPSDFTNQPGGDATIQRMLELDVPKQKIVYGCGFYGRGGTGISPGASGTGICMRYYDKQGMFFDYHDIVTKIESGEFTQYIDEKAIAAYAYNGDTFITYDNPWTLKQKVKYIKKNGLAGIMYWEHQTDLTRTLINAIIEEVNNE